MASNLIPMLSSSPPPMDENGSFDDEDDDFGDFTCAGGVKVLDSPLNSPSKSSAPSLSPQEEKLESEGKKVTWNNDKNLDSGKDEPSKKPSCHGSENNFLPKEDGTFSEKIVVFSEDVEEFNCDEDEIDFEEKQGLSAKYVFTHSELHDNTSQESVTDSGLCSSSQRSETSPLPPGEAMFPELSPETEVEETQDVFPEDPQMFCVKPDLELAQHSEDVADSFDDTTTPVNEPQSFDDSLHVTLDEEDNFQEFLSSSSKETGFDLNDQNVAHRSETSENVQPAARTEKCDSEDADDFADFACAQFDPTAGGSTEPCDETFADFSQVSFDNSGATEDSGWANFTSSSEAPSQPTTTCTPLPQQFSSFQTATVQHLLDSAFPFASCGSLEEEHKLLPVQPILGNETSHSCLLWRCLEDLDGSVSLQYQWSGSHSFQKILQALNIDSRNVDIIPPAQFDWSSSGLVNPLDPSQSSSTLLDLDFFTNIETSHNTTSSITGRSHAGKTSSLEEELLGMDPMHSPGLEPMQQPGGEDLVQKLLLSVPSSSLVGTVGQMHGTDSRTMQLSTQAAGLLGLLPDFSFMQAKVLMFPIRSTLES